MQGRRAVHVRTGQALAEELETPRTKFGGGPGLMLRKPLEPGGGLWPIPCRRVGSWLCDRCGTRIRRLEERLCRGCGVELFSARKDCACSVRLKSLTRLRSAVAYEGPIEPAVHRFKYEGWRRLAGPLASLIAERLAVEGVSAPWVVAVPLHPMRERQRGFNQAELLARELRRRLGSGVPPGVLVRTRATPPQVGHDRKRRV